MGVKTVSGLRQMCIGQSPHSGDRQMGKQICVTRPGQRWGFRTRAWFPQCLLESSNQSNVMS